MSDYRIVVFSEKFLCIICFFPSSVLRIVVLKDAEDDRIRISYNDSPYYTLYR